MHFDPEYIKGGDPAQRCTKLKPNGDSSGPFGNYNCDTPTVTVDDSLNFMTKAEPNPDFILYTGDSVPHYLYYSGGEVYTEQMVLANVLEVNRRLGATWPNKPIYPCFGNHDTFPSDQLPPPPNEYSRRWFLNITQSWIDSGFAVNDPKILETARNGGYYTTLIKPGLRLVALNTVLCDILNIHAFIHQEADFYGQMQWWNQTMFDAERAGEKVMIIGHRSPGVGDDGLIKMTVGCDRRFNEIVEQYYHIIVGMFFGHEHEDAFHIFHDIATNTKPLAVMFLTPSVTTFTFQNPSVRLFEYDPDSNSVVNFYTFTTNLTAANRIGKLVWTVEYDALSAYQMKSLAASEWQIVIDRMQRDPSTWALFRRLYQAGYWLDIGQQDPCTFGSRCMQVQICSMRTSSLPSFDACIKSQSHIASKV